MSGYHQRDQTADERTVLHVLGLAEPGEWTPGLYLASRLCASVSYASGVVKRLQQKGHPIACRRFGGGYRLEQNGR